MIWFVKGQVNTLRLLVKMCCYLTCHGCNVAMLWEIINDDRLFINIPVKYHLAMHKQTPSSIFIEYFKLGNVWSQITP